MAYPRVAIAPLLALTLYTACGGEPQDSSEAIDDALPSSTFVWPPIGPLSPRAGRTTPSDVEVQIGDRADYVAVQTYVSDASARVVTQCQAAEAYLIGPHALDRPRGAPVTFPLDYTEVLPPGRYVEHVLVYTHSYRTHALVKGGHQVVSRRFRVSGDDLTPLDGFFSSVSRSPCPPFEVYTDEVGIEDATTVVHADEWRNSGSLQPIRWRRGDGSNAPDAASVFVFKTFNAAGSSLSFRARVAPTAEPPRDVMLDLTEGAASLVVAIDPFTRSQMWSSRSGLAHIRRDPDGRWSITFSDVALENYGTLIVDRHIESGSITGQLVMD